MQYVVLMPPANPGSGGTSILQQLVTVMRELDYRVHVHVGLWGHRGNELGKLLARQPIVHPKSYGTDWTLIAPEIADISSIRYVQCIRFNLYFNPLAQHPNHNSSNICDIFFWKLFHDYESQWRAVKNIPERRLSLPPIVSGGLMLNLGEILHRTSILNSPFERRPIHYAALFRKADGNRYNGLYNKPLSTALLGMGLKHLARIKRVDQQLHCDVRTLIHRCSQIRVLYCFDLFTFTSTIAALCGCDVRLIAFPPFQNLTELFKDVPYATLGVALNDSPSELNRAHNTRHQLRAELQAIRDGQRSYAFTLDSTSTGYRTLCEQVRKMFEQAHARLDHVPMPPLAHSSPQQPTAGHGISQQPQQPQQPQQTHINPSPSC
jgi:hypothetical protein